MNRPRGALVAVFIGAAIAALSLCCCVGTVVAAVAWGDDLYRRIADGETVRLGETGRDGAFEFTVSGVECGVGQIGDPFINLTAAGQYCLAMLTVQNVGNRPATFADALQRAYGPDGSRYAADSGAGILANAEQQVFLNEINPGNRVSGTIVYDIPPAGRIVKLELHESKDTPGLTVTV